MDRKALLRQYKEAARPMGVYRVSSTVTGRSLVGSSTDLRAALNRHRAQLRMNSHPNRELQRDWNGTGPESFEFETLDELPANAEPGYDPGDDLAVLLDLWNEKLGTGTDRY